jgi:predicted SAM-dependent methyltransferase
MTDLKVNFGSGQTGLASWINIDIGTKYTVYRFLPLFKMMRRLRLVSPEIVSWIQDSGKPPPNWRRWNIVEGTPLDDLSVDYVYCSEVIEHFPKYQARRIVKEKYRILKHGGVFRLTTPDIRAICNSYLSGWIDVDFFNSFFFWVNQTERPKFLERFGARIYSTNPHLYLYDYESLKRLLEEEGFCGVSMLEALKGRTPDLRFLEANSDPHRKLSMYVECVKE